MGAFLVNFHVRTDNPDPVTGALRQYPLARAWIAGPHDGWISFWEEQSSQQNSERIQSIAEHISKSLDVPVIAFLVHDSDILCYWLYHEGAQLDEYNSCPSYWGDEEIEEEPLEADCAHLVRFCRPGIDESQLESILKQSKLSDLANGEMPEFVFVEQRLSLLAPLLGIREDLLSTDFNDIGREIAPEELGAMWIGEGDPPEGESGLSSMLQEAEEAGYQAMMPHGPLHAAAMSNDIATIEKLVSEGADINEIPHAYAVSVLGMAASQGTPETIRRLVALGADLGKKGPEGATPLRLAITASKTENVRTLVELGADLSETDPQLGTLLHLAMITQSSLETIRLLLELGVDPEVKNSAGFTLLQMVQMQLEGMKQIEGLLKGRDASIMAPQLERLRAIAELLGNSAG